VCINNFCFCATVCKMVRPMLSDCCPVLSVRLVCCGQTARWIKMPLDTEVGLGPGHTVLDGDPAPPMERGIAAPSFRPTLLWHGRPLQQLVSSCYTFSAFVRLYQLLWPPWAADVDIVFLACGLILSFFFSSPNLSSRRLNVYHTSTHGVSLLRI